MENIRVLFIGNSHTFFNDMPQIFAKICEGSGTAHVEATMQAHPGVHLGWHLSQRWELRYGLIHGGYDYVVFQQAAHPCPPKEETLTDGAELVKLIREAGATPIATITWAERRFPENQAKMYDIFSALADQTGVKCSPVGQVFERVQKVAKDIDLFFFDGEHCSPYGSYVVAACAYAQIFGKSPVGLPCTAIKNTSGTAEEYAELEAALAELGKDPTNSVLQNKAKDISVRSYGVSYDKGTLDFELDHEKCARLQQIIAEEVEKYNNSRK